MTNFQLTWTPEMEAAYRERFYSLSPREVDLVNALAPLIAKQVAEECASIADGRVLAVYHGDMGNQFATEIRDIIRSRFGLDGKGGA